MDNQNEIQLTREAQKQQELTQQVNELFALKSEHLENFERGPRTLEQQEHHEAMVDSMLVSTGRSFCRYSAAVASCFRPSSV